MKLMHDCTDPFTIHIQNSLAGDSTHMLFRSADKGRYLKCISGTFCESVGQAAEALAGSWAKLQLRPAIPGNHYCFHLYTSSVLPICYDDDRECLVQGPPEPGCEPAVFALQTASSVSLLQEIIDTTGLIFEQKRKLSSLESNVVAKRALCEMDNLINRLRDRNGKEQVPSVSSRRDAEEEQLVFLESNLEFQKEQLHAALERAGEGAEHGLPEACILDDCEDSFSCGRSAPSQNSPARSRSRFLAALSPSKIARSLLAGLSPSKAPCASFASLRLQ